MFFRYYKENLIYPDAQPNNAHIALAKLEQEGKLSAVVTQNIDGLHQKAGDKKFMSFTAVCSETIVKKCGSFMIQIILWMNPTVKTGFLTANAAVL